MDYDGAFFDRLVDAWGVSQRFQELAEGLTPPPVQPGDVQEVEKAIEEARGSFNFKEVSARKKR